MRALLSVYDKDGIVEFARSLRALGVELISSGGTAKTIADAGIEVTDVAELTGYPHMLGHRVVTLHPLVHGGLLADRDDPEHMADVETYAIPLIDLVVVNLYPFESDPSVELIDIGGPAMIRAAAKNHEHVAVVVDPADYATVLEDLRTTGTVRPSTRAELARSAFARTAQYDASIVRWLDAGDELPPSLNLSLTRQADLRYGENPHQPGALYTSGAGPWTSVRQLNGKELSYLNVFDADAAWRLVWSLGSEPAAVVVKHANPCGVAVGADVVDAYRRAHECDPVSAFGGIVAVNRPLDVPTAQAITEVFTEVVVAPAIDDAALVVLREKANLRVLVMERPEPPSMPELRSVSGGFLAQPADSFVAARDDWTVVTRRSPDDHEWADLELAWRVAARVSSNTIVLVRNGQAVGIGAGQQNRRDAGRLAAEKAAGRARGGACASDAFFPFRDGLDAAIEAGATAVIQPGGSVRDAEVVAAADESNVAMVFTGERHFRH